MHKINSCAAGVEWFDMQILLVFNAAASSVYFDNFHNCNCNCEYYMKLDPVHSIKLASAHILECKLLNRTLIILETAHTYKLTTYTENRSRA